MSGRRKMRSALVQAGRLGVGSNEAVAGTRPYQWTSETQHLSLGHVENGRAAQGASGGAFRPALVLA